MKGMPLLLMAKKPMQGPMVPAFSRFKRIRSEGMVQGDRVKVYGFSGSHRKDLVEFWGPDDCNIELRLDLVDYVQAEYLSNGKGINLWLE